MGKISFTPLSGIDVSLSYADADAAATRLHNWHVHANGGINTTDCLSAGGHWDPDGKEVGTYAADGLCTSDTNYTNCCEHTNYRGRSLRC